ncbi:MAG: 3-phosphoshikimate 1-carboxyvinyltransferase [Bacteroidota bacterium]|nr:3-phosphoshikimate 1-carboxyvinyltransferase [Bacteroidota bacterium]
MIKILKKVSGNERVTIHLPASKSISNRLLVLQKLYNIPVNFHNLSESDDTQVLYHCLNQNILRRGGWDVGNCGTAMRFLLSYAAITLGKYIISGDERMHQRPIKPLVDAWKELGAEINYIEEEGYPPLEVVGKELINYSKDIEIDGSISSQYISSLMMAGCKLGAGLSIHLVGNISSRPYIKMTLTLMQEIGLDIMWDEELDIIKCNKYTEPKHIVKNYFIESDWSAASYCYLWALAIPALKIEIENLTTHSLQGDSIISEYFKMFGVKTIQFDGNKISITNNQNTLNTEFEFDCTHCLDMTPTLALAAYITQTKVKLTGLANLKHKESNRLKVLYTELNKFSNNSATIIADDILYIHRIEPINFDETLETYADHRIAMAFSALAAFGDLKINNPEVVSKSFPSFWDELKKLGVELVCLQ